MTRKKPFRFRLSWCALGEKIVVLLKFEGGQLDPKTAPEAKLQSML